MEFDFRKLQELIISVIDSDKFYSSIRNLNEKNGDSETEAYLELGCFRGKYSIELWTDFGSGIARCYRGSVDVKN